MSDIKEYLRQAIQLATDNIRNNEGGPFGAVVVKDGVVIGKGVNKVTTHNDPTAHAEINAIRDACQNLESFQLKDCEIYSSCEPCPMCLGAIYWARPKKLYFAASRQEASQAGFDDTYIYHELNLDFAERKISTEQVQIKEAKDLFNEWINTKNKIEY
ncbi:MAG: nucleoside deaminase [Bacteroidales bacterium]|nr:nucleoside deaminase [Bacteroidales bacterium]MCF8403958.1 nucleoside deaminase [Bacteroidales bacterium]